MMSFPTCGQQTETPKIRFALSPAVQHNEMKVEMQSGLRREAFSLWKFQIVWSAGALACGIAARKLSQARAPALHFCVQSANASPQIALASLFGIGIVWVGDREHETEPG